jgi:hypothetical protein
MLNRSRELVQPGDGLRTVDVERPRLVAGRNAAPRVAALPVAAVQYCRMPSVESLFFFAKTASTLVEQ